MSSALLPFTTGHICNLYLSSEADKPCLVKIPKSLEDNCYVQRERQTIADLRKTLPLDYSKFIPQLYGYEIIDGVRASKLELFPGFFDGTYVKPIDARTLVWVWKRLMGLLSWVHRLKIVHGAILPCHLMVFPDNNKRTHTLRGTHEVRLIDWAYAVPYARKSLEIWCPDYRGFYPPEVLNKTGLGATVDLYMSAKTMVYMLGGQAGSSVVPSAVPNRIAQVLKNCMHAAPGSRTPSAGVAFNEMKAAAEEAFGDPQFHELLLPGI